jgi:hypothetical protein
VTEESKGSPAVPGSGAGDAAPTQAIPRIAKPSASSSSKTPAATSAPAKTTPAKKAPAKQSPGKQTPSKPAATTTPAAGQSAGATSAQKTSGTSATSGSQGARTSGSSQTDKGRPRKTTTAATSTAASAASTTSAPTTPDKKRQIQPVGGPSGRPLTAADYEHTTKGSPESTAVIPAVKDRPDDTPRTSRPDAAVAPGSGRRASLRLTHVEPWSVTRLAFAISVAMMIVAVVAVAIFWFVLDFVGVWDQINDSFTTVLSDDSTAFNVTDYFGIGRVLGLTLVLSAVNVVLMTALATIGAHLYNLAAQLMGGVEVTLAEDK